MLSILPFNVVLGALRSLVLDDNIPLGITAAVDNLWHLKSHQKEEPFKLVLCFSGSGGEQLCMALLNPEISTLLNRRNACNSLLSLDYSSIQYSSR